MQKPFSSLSERAQLRRMTRLACKALEAYALPVFRVSPLKQEYNHNFRIIAESGERYMLRIYHPRRTSAGPVRSELLWLAALRQDTDLIVPEPVLNKQTDYITVLKDDNLLQPRLCALYHWTYGRFLYRTLTPSHLFQVGELMAHLQNHAAHWERPAGFTRRRVDNLFCLRQEQDDHFDGTVAEHAIRAVAEVSTPQDGVIVEAVIRKVWAVLQGLGEGLDNLGLFHADVHQSNYLFYKGRVGLIDFDDCGYGHWLYDLAVTPYCLQDHPNYSSLREAFLTGYRQSRPLSSDHEALIGTFMALRTLQDMLWVIEERSQPAFRDRWHALMIGGLQALREFVNK